MDPKKLALLIGALVVAAVAAITAKNMFSATPAPQAQAAPVAVPTGPKVLVATRSLPVGTIIDRDSFRYQPWPKELIENAYYVEGSADPASLAGTVVRNTISAGQPLTQGSLVKPGDRGFLAAALGPGMRAVTVSVSTSSGVAGFIFPGDRVDLMLTQTVSGEQGPSLKATETFLSNIRVLATDQRTVPDEDDKGNRKVSTFTTVTLEVTPRFAEKIAVAQTIGQLSLSLRSIADNNAELDRAIAAGEVTVPAGTDPKAQRSVLLNTVSRPSDAGTSFVTGADVSRFQRRSVPVATAPVSNYDPTPRPQYAGGRTGGVAPVRTAPVVRIARGNTVSEVSVGNN